MLMVHLLQAFDAPPQGQTISGLPLGWLLQIRARIAVVQSWIPRRSSETREKTVLLEEAPRNPVQETALRAVSCTPGTPRSHARPRLVTESGVAMGLGAGARNGRSPPLDHQVSCFAPGRIYVVRQPMRPDGTPFAMKTLKGAPPGAG